MRSVKSLNWTFFTLVALMTAACGVKGKPLPQLTPPVLGRGEPSLSKASDGVKLKKKNTNSQGEPDWDDDEDFKEESNP